MIMSRHAVRAKIRHKNKDIHLGYYASKAQAMAAQDAAHVALDKWEELNPPLPTIKRKMPSVKTLMHFISAGTYDTVIEQLAEATTGRYHLIKTNRHKKGTWTSDGAFPTRTTQRA